MRDFRNALERVQIPLDMYLYLKRASFNEAEFALSTVLDKSYNRKYDYLYSMLPGKISQVINN